MTHNYSNPLLSVKWPSSPKNSMHAQTTYENMADGKSAQTEQRQNRSSSLSLFVFLETFYRSPPWLDYSWLSQHPLLWFCQEPWIHSWLRNVHEEARHKKSAKLLISSLNALVQSKGFSLKTQPRPSCYFLYPFTVWLLQLSPRGYT